MMNLNKSNSSSEQCFCHNALVIDRRSASRLVALSLLSLFGIFAAGYFLGKKKGSELFALKVEQEAFADQMNVALHTLYSTDPGMPDSQIGSENDQEDETFEQGILSQLEPQEQEVKTPSKRYQALLMGGTSKDVQAFAGRLNKRGIKVNVKVRHGKNKKGNQITWHQAITSEFSNKEEFDKLIVAIKKTEKINEKILELG